MQPLITTLIERPYVFAFLLAFLFLGFRLFGWRRTVLWLFCGYAIAWASEFSSIQNSFPYGEYHYLYANMPGELMILGVPFFDSLSYSFLTFAGFSMASYALGTLRRAQSGLGVILLGALLTMLLDVIIDPIATMGKRWFLGEIHYYAHPGWYFGIPLSNFAGWFLVAFTIIGANALLWRLFPRSLQLPETLLPAQKLDIFFPLFYAGIALFNIFMSFWIGEWLLGVVSSLILAGILGMTAALHPKQAS